MGLKELMPCGLHSTSLMAIDMARNWGDDTLPGTKEGGDGSEIGLSTANHKLYVGIGRGA